MKYHAPHKTPTSPQETALSHLSQERLRLRRREQAMTELKRLRDMMR